MNKYLAFGEVIETDIDFDGELPNSTAETTLLIVNKPFTEEAKEITKVYRAGVQATFSKHAAFDILTWEGIVKYKISDSEINYELLGATDAALRIFTLSEAIGTVLLRRGNFLLHGSSILVNGRVHVFIGEPGAGKSTTAAAFYQAGCSVLSDDLTVIAFKNNIPVVLSGIPTLKVWQSTLDGLGISTKGLKKSVEGGSKYLVRQEVESFPATHFPLHSVTFILDPGKNKQVSLITPTRTPVELVKHFPLPDQLLTGEKLKQHFEQCIKLSNSVSLSNINRPAGFRELREFVSERLK